MDVVPFTSTIRAEWEVRIIPKFMTYNFPAMSSTSPPKVFTYHSVGRELELKFAGVHMQGLQLDYGKW